MIKSLEVKFIISKIVKNLNSVKLFFVLRSLCKLHATAPTGCKIPVYNRI